MGRTARETIMAVQHATTWGTAVAPGALDGYLPISIDNFALQGNTVREATIGNDEYRCIESTEHVVQPTIVMPLRRTGAEWRFLAALFGNDTLTGAGPYTHTLNWQTETADILTVAHEINNADIFEVPSFFVTGITIAPDGDGFLAVTIEGMGNTVMVAADATSASGDFDAVTYTTRCLKIPFRESLWRFNAQASGALSGSDDYDVSDFSLSIRRPVEIDRLAIGATDNTEKEIGIPVQSGPTEIQISTTAPDYTTAALLDEYKDGTAAKATFTASRTIATIAYSLTFEFGHLIPEPSASGIAGEQRIPLTRNFIAREPDSTPTGLSTADIVHCIMVDNQNAQYVA